jgi:hypothetical protein
MIDIASVVDDLNRARRARIDAELACSDIEELAETIRCSHLAFRRLIAERSGPGGRAHLQARIEDSTAAYYGALPSEPVDNARVAAADNATLYESVKALFACSSRVSASVASVMDPVPLR